MTVAGPSVLRLAQVTVLFAQPARLGLAALSEVNLQIAAGERVALVGANGCGKSTLLRVMHGLVAASQGTCWCAPEVRQAMLFQRPHMLRTSALNHVALGLRLQGLTRSEACEHAQKALERVGLGDSASRPAYTLSGGQQQRLALARAWALQPQVLLLDEPTASLDPHAKREVEALMEAFAGGGLTMVFASHNLGQVKRLASRVVYLEQGRILADMPVQDFFHADRLGAVSAQAQLFVKGELA